MVERAQKTIQNYLVAYEMNKDNFDFFKAIPQITELYNAKLNLSDDLSPYERIFSTKSPTYIAKFHNIDLEQENLKIAKLRKQILKKAPIGAKVRLTTTPKQHSKDALSEKFTAEFYYIYAIKSPILSEFPFKFRIRNAKHEKLSGLFLFHEFKVMKK